MTEGIMKQIDVRFSTSHMAAIKYSPDFARKPFFAFGKAYA
jgi:hypothetical protein